MKEIKHLEKMDRKYIIASVDNGMYLTYKNYKYSFVTNIAYATKFMNKKIAEKYIDYYAIDTLDNQFDLVIIPLVIEYSLIEEADIDE